MGQEKPKNQRQIIIQGELWVRASQLRLGSLAKQVGPGTITIRRKGARPWEQRAREDEGKPRTMNQNRHCIRDLFPPILAHSDYHNLLNIYQSHRWEIVTCFLFIPMITSRAEHLFICLLPIRISCFMNCLLLFFVHFLVRLFVFFFWVIWKSRNDLSSTFPIHVRTLFSQWLFSSW